MNITELENIESSGHKKSTLSTTGKILIGITGGIAVGLSVICAPFVSPALRKHCLPYIPATNEQVKNIFIALKHRKGSLIDLGSGDGRIVIDAANKGFTSHGVELNFWLVAFSKLNAIKSGVGTKTKFFRRDLWKYNLKPYNNIVIFGVEQMMSDLELKFLNECSSDTVIVACRFPLPNLTPIQTVGSGIDTVWIYNIPKR